MTHEKYLYYEKVKVSRNVRRQLVSFHHSWRFRAWIIASKLPGVAPLGKQTDGRTLLQAVPQLYNIRNSSIALSQTCSLIIPFRKQNQLV